MKYIDAGTTAEKISNEFEIPMSELCDVFADIPSADVQPIVDTENMATVTDEFICKKMRHILERLYQGCYGRG